MPWLSHMTRREWKIYQPRYNKLATTHARVETLLYLFTAARDRFEVMRNNFTHAQKGGLGRDERAGFAKFRVPFGLFRIT